MTKRSFNKPPLTYLQQIQQLKQRGLLIENVPPALHVLENLSDFRLSGYWYLLLDDKITTFLRTGVNFKWLLTSIVLTGN